MKTKLFLLLMIVFAFSGNLNAQLFSDSVVINSNGRTFNWLSASNDYLFVNDDSHDSIYVIDLITKSIISSKKITSNGQGRVKYSKNKLFVAKDDYSVDMYDVSNVHNITYQQSLGGFNQGWLRSDQDDTTYFYWMEHWNQKIRIIDFSTGTMVVKSNPGTGGNVQGASRIGNFLYCSNAYQMSKRFDITNPVNPTSINFGVQGAGVSCSNNYVVFGNYFGGHVVSIWNQSGAQLSSITGYDLNLVTRDNYCMISVWNTTTGSKLYNISGGNFNNYVATAPRSIGWFNDYYWIAMTSNKIILYPRYPFPATQASDIVFSNVSSNQFTFNWTDGNGSKRTVFIKQDSTGTASPVNNTTYNASTVFGSGSQIGTTGWYCVFNGTTHTSGITVTNLLPNKNYRVMVCEYNGNAGYEQYNTTTASNNPVTKKTCSENTSIPSEGLVAWYPFNGNANDECGNGNNGIVNGAVLTSDRFENANKAFYFDGTNDYINIPFSFGNCPEFSISAWFNIDTLTGTHQAIVSSTTACFEHLQCNSSGNIGFYTKSYGTILLPIISLYPQDSWRHVVFSIKSGVTKVYENGTLISYSNQIFDTITLANLIRIGSGYLNGRFFHGKIDDVRLYNRALTDCEISSLYQEVSFPANQATNIVFSNITSNQFTFNWSDGNGSKRAVFVKQDNTGSALPINNTTYTANTNFGSGSQIGTSGWFCVFNGTTHSTGVTVTNLIPNTTYRVMVCEYNGVPGAEQYNISTAINNPNNQSTCLGNIPTDGLAAWYPFNGNANDASGNGNHGIVNGAILVQDRFGNINSAYSFDGIDDKINCGNGSSLQIGGDITVGVWIKTLNPSQLEKTAIGKYQWTSVGWEITTTSINKIQFDGRDPQWRTSGPSNIIIANDVWHFVVGQRIGSVWKIFVDGILSNQNNVGTTGSLICGVNLNIGCDWNQYFYNGLVDDVRIYNRALSDCEIQALYQEAMSYLVTVAPNPIAGGSVSGGGIYYAGTTATVTAVPSTGYTFINWTENGNVVSTNASYSFTVTGDRNLVANFTIQQFMINTSSNPANGGTTGGGGAYNYGSQATVSATQNTNWAFINWTENGYVVSTSLDYTFTVTTNRNLVANFTQLPTYLVTTTSAPAEGGTTSGGGNYISGQIATVSAIPNTGYNFVNWSEYGNVVATIPVYSFVVTSNHNLVANFELQQFSITTSSNPSVGGTTSGGGIYNYGSTASVTASASAGWAFNYWSENGSIVSTNPSYSFTVISDRNLVANFIIQSVQYTITATPNPVNAGSTSGGGIYNSGATAVLEAFANPGWVFLNWTEYGSLVSTNPIYSFVVTGNRDLVANFVNEYIVTATAVPIDGGYTLGGGVYPAGQVITLQAIPNYGWNFSNWTENGNIVSTNPIYSLTVNENHAFEANFINYVGTVENSQSGIVAYPNPAKDKLFISHVVLTGQKDYDVQIINSLGQLILTKNILNETSGTISIDIDGFTSGLYYLNLYEAGTKSSYYFKFIVQH